MIAVMTFWNCNFNKLQNAVLQLILNFYLHMKLILFLREIIIIKIIKIIKFIV